MPQSEQKDPQLPKKEESAAAEPAAKSPVGASVPEAKSAPDAAAGAAPKTFDAEIADAAEACSRAINAARETATKETSRRKLEGEIARQQITLATQHACMTAQQAWSTSVLGVEPGSQGAAETLGNAAERYHDAINDAVRKGHDAWERAWHDQNEATDHARKAYQAAVEHAAVAYLDRLKALWRIIEPAQMCASAVARLAAATVGAAQTVAALARS